MRYFGITTLAASVLMLGACGGGEKKAEDTVVVDTVSAAAAAAPATAGTPAPITGTTHEVKMVGDAQGYRFEPAEITVKAGDGIKYVFVSGGPHNVAFDPAVVPADVKPQLLANMPNQMTELSGPYMNNPGESYLVSFGGIKAGTYEVHCTPHLAMNMKQKVTVQ